VSQIVLDGDVLLIGVGGQIVAWQARREPEKGANAWGKVGKGKKSTNGKGGVFQQSGIVSHIQVYLPIS
jgi:hypothetical protein